MAVINKVTFYTLPTTIDKFEFATKLASQLWRKELRKSASITIEDGGYLPLWLLCDHQSALKQMDRLLWQYEQDSFIAHKVVHHYGEFNLAQRCIALSLAMPVPQWQGIVINLSPYVVNHFQINNIVEIIAHSEQEKSAGRERYKHYQQLSFSIKHYRIGSSN